MCVYSASLLSDMDLMAWRGFVILLAALQLVSGARPQVRHNSHTSDLKLAAVAENGTSGCWPEAKQKGWTTWMTNYPADSWVWFSRTPKDLKPCAVISGYMTCLAGQPPTLKRVEFEEGSVVCGKNSNDGITKKIKAANALGCRVYIESSTKTTPECMCPPCSYGAMAGEPKTLVTWRRVFENQKEKQTPAQQNTFHEFAIGLGAGINSVRLWINNHPRTIMVLKIVTLIIVGVLTGGIATAAVVAVGLTFTVVGLLTATANAALEWNAITHSTTMTPEVKMACAGLRLAKFVLTLTFASASLVIPVAPEVGVEMLEHSDFGTLAKNALLKAGADAEVAHGHSISVGIAQAELDDLVKKKLLTWTSCTETEEVELYTSKPRNTTETSITAWDEDDEYVNEWEKLENQVTGSHRLPNSTAIPGVFFFYTPDSGHPRDMVVVDGVAVFREDVPGYVPEVPVHGPVVVDGVPDHHGQ